MAEVEEIAYTPEERSEIERIVDLVAKSGRKLVAVREPAAAHAETAVMEQEEAPSPAVVEEDYHPAPDSFQEPEDLELPAIDFQHLDGGKKPAPPAEEDTVSIEDISGLVHEVEEKFPGVKGKPEPEPLEDFTLEMEEAPEKAAPAPSREEEKLTPLDELDRLTKDEPESLDHADRVPSDSLTGKSEPARRESPRFEMPPAPKGGRPVVPVVEEESLPADMAVFDDITVEPAPAETPPEGVSLGKEIKTDIPDLSEISFDDGAVMPETRAADVPDLDIAAETGTAAPVMEAAPQAGPAMDELTDEDLASIRDIEEFREEPMIKPSRDIIGQVRQKDEAGAGRCAGDARRS